MVFELKLFVKGCCWWRKFDGRRKMSQEEEFRFRMSELLDVCERTSMFMEGLDLEH
jgi:hypothetical protein